MDVHAQHGAVESASVLAAEMGQTCLGLRVGRLHRIVSRRFEQALRPLGLSLPQMELLSSLTLWDGPARPSDLADVLAIERSTMSRNLALLESRGLVAAGEKSPAGRLMTVAITSLGSRTLASANAAWSRAQHDVLSQVGDRAPEILTGWIASLSAAEAQT